MPSYQTLWIQQLDSITTVTLNRPQIHNAFNEAMIAELTEVFQAFSFDPQTRIVILTGAGESFCAGADLNWMKRMVDYSHEENLEDSQKLHRMLHAVYCCSKPVIAKINGSAIGGGTGLVAAADLAIAEEKAQFCFSEVRLGLIPAVISPFVLRKIGESNAREYFLTAQRFGATEAQRMGLIRESCKKEELEQKIEEKIKLLKSAGPEALAETKRLIDQVAGQPIEQASFLTTLKIAERRVSPEGQEGIQAFLERRKPRWSEN